MSHGQEMYGGLNDETSTFIQSQQGNGSGENVVQQPPPDTLWKSTSRTVEEGLTQGLSNEDLWMLIRRFNKQIYHVTAVQDSAAQDLDLNRREQENFPPEKLRITVERFYTTVIVGIIESFRHVARLRSWNEPQRTSVLCIVYFFSWALDLLVPTILSLIAVLMMIPSIRPLVFPENTRPIKSSSSNSSHLNKVHIKSLDSLTGAPECHKGEAAEQEARNLVDTFATVAMESAAARYGQAIVEEVPDLTTITDSTGTVNDLAEPSIGDLPEDKTEKPMKKKVRHATDETMRMLSDITDLYERLANLCSPTPPFFLITSRLRMIAILSTMSVVMPFISSYWIIKLIGFSIGLGFFGEPIFTYTLRVLNEIVPSWKACLDIQKYGRTYRHVYRSFAYGLARTLLAGVPTNAQLTLTLLRIGEINSSPLPPPPAPVDNEPFWPFRRTKSQATISTPTEQGSSVNLQSNPTEGLSDARPKRTVLKILKLLRRTIATAIKGHIAFDRAMAIAGSSHTKNLIGMLQNRHLPDTPSGPLIFDAKFERKRGAAVLDSSKQPPLLYFTTYQSAGLQDLRIESRKKGSVLFQIPITDIKELRKTEGLGWKRKLVVELTAGSKEAADGLIIIGDEVGQSFHLTGMRSRNELFNRLIAIDAQFWESR